MATYREVFKLSQRLLKDHHGMMIKEGTLKPLMLEATRALYRKMASNGLQVLTNQALLTLTTAQNPVTVDNLGGAPPTIISLTSTPLALPTDFIQPQMIRERINGTTGKLRMMERDEHTLPNIERQPRLRIWTWRQQRIELLGSTRDVEIEITYESTFADFANLQTTIPIENAVGAIAHYTAFLYRGGTQDYINFDEQSDHLINSESRSSQFEPVRRIPYRYR